MLRLVGWHYTIAKYGSKDLPETTLECQQEPVPVILRLYVHGYTYCCRFGTYEDNGQFLIVNCGFAYDRFCGRVTSHL